ncbi:mechanosensitive ion channel family protein [Zooshikella sp. RANM57]|uniref:mechanosensitive ion channel family protein n=1 Tax=Zooshikella sp. RANM57 TaxID=3425863 RepID=UPI003D6E47E3
MNELITENKLIVSALLIIIAICIRWLAVKQLRKIPSGEDELPRRWINGIRNALTTLVVVGLIIIWLSELKFVALSIATFTVALIFATREFIQCFMGAIYQTSVRAFAVGDWIKIGDHCGKVVSSDWLTTKLLEIDLESMSYVYTGKTLVIPNNQLFLSPIYNLNFMRHYVIHTFTITRDSDLVNVCQAKDFILAKAKIYCEPHEELAKKYEKLLEKRLGVDLPGPEASVRITTTTLGKNEFSISIFCSTKEATTIEQKLTADFMRYWYSEVERLKVDKKAHKTQEYNRVTEYTH